MIGPESMSVPSRSNRTTGKRIASIVAGRESGLSAERAADLLASQGPNALPEEKPRPGWRRFLDEYRAYMQIILVAAAVVSVLVKEWSTAILLLLLTVLNAIMGVRQEGKAESAMNALRSMMKATARVRRDGTEAQIPADRVVPGDVVTVEVEGLGALTNTIVSSPAPVSGQVGAQPTATEEVLSTALGGDWPLRGQRPPERTTHDQLPMPDVEPRFRS